jgi:hypothetical protein
VKLVWAAKLLAATVIQSTAEEQNLPELQLHLSDLANKPWWEAAHLPSERIELTLPNLSTLLTSLLGDQGTAATLVKSTGGIQELKGWLAASISKALKDAYIVETILPGKGIQMLANGMLKTPEPCSWFTKAFESEKTISEPPSRMILIEMANSPTPTDADTRVTKASHKRWADLQVALLEEWLSCRYCTEKRWHECLSPSTKKRLATAMEAIRANANCDKQTSSASTLAVITAATQSTSPPKVLSPQSIRPGLNSPAKTQGEMPKDEVQSSKGSLARKSSNSTEPKTSTREDIPSPKFSPKSPGQDQDDYPRGLR